MSISSTIRGGNYRQLRAICRQLITVHRQPLCTTSSQYTNISNSENCDGDVKRKTIDVANSSNLITDADIKKSVFISQSYDVFANLALEDWLYRHFDFSRHHVLFLWANDPCVVIGRHQNPFTEANVSNLVDKGITLARRNSGGGAVYHDRGNLNCTFFTPRERYNRKYNLNILTRALFREWAIKSEINKRDDIIINDKKVSIYEVLSEPKSLLGIK